MSILCSKIHSRVAHHIEGHVYSVFTLIPWTLLVFYNISRVFVRYLTLLGYFILLYNLFNLFFTLWNHATFSNHTVIKPRYAPGILPTTFQPDTNMHCTDGTTILWPSRHQHSYPLIARSYTYFTFYIYTLTCNHAICVLKIFCLRSVSIATTFKN